MKFGHRLGTALLGSTLLLAGGVLAEPKEEDGVVYFTVDAFEVTGENPLGADQTRELRSMGADELRKGGAKYQRLLEERALAELGYS